MAKDPGQRRSVLLRPFLLAMLGSSAWMVWLAGPSAAATDIVPVIPPLPKAVPYPPESIWRTWEDGKPTQYRGNTFRRQGHIVARVFDVTPTP